MTAPITVAVPPEYDDGPNARTALMRAVRAQHPDADHQVVEVGGDDARPGWRVVTLAKGGTPASWDISDTVADWGTKGAADAVERALVERGARLAAWDPTTRTARAVHGGTFDVRLRDKLAAAYGVGGTPWEVEARAVHGVDGLIDRYIVDRAPAGRDATRDLYALPGVEPWWELRENTWHGTVTLQRVERPVLPALVPLADILPERITPGVWSRLPLGFGPDGEVVALDLELGPHAILVGPPGSGKSVGINSLAAGALMRGFELVVVVDPSKGRTDFKALAPWVSAWGTDSMAQVRQTLEAVYAEGSRRRAIVSREGVDRWDRLPGHVRERDGVRPLMLIVDEASSLLVMPDSKVINGLEKDSPEQLEMRQLVADTTMTHYLLGKLARELRFVGIHLVVATQRPDAAIIGGELRSLLSSAVQLSPPLNPVAKTALGMLFAGDQVEQAHEALSLYGTPPHPGLAVTAGEGGGVQALRVAYQPAAGLAALLTERGVPTATPWAVANMSDAVEQELEAVIVDHGELQLDWGADWDEVPAAHEESPAELSGEPTDRPKEPTW